jgi:hypothetical protein
VKARKVLLLMIALLINQQPAKVLPMSDSLHGQNR